jgi:glutamate N-acetyltransferase/amino-acid N-acetyltransferase
MFEPDRVAVKIGAITVFEHGRPAPGDLDSLLAPHMRRQDIVIEIELGQGGGEYVLLASDLTTDYVKINADYRS